MQVSIEQGEGLKRKLSVVVDEKEIAKARNAAMNRVAKTARVDGFRKGHLPQDILLQRFGREVAEETINSIVTETIEDALEKLDAKKYGQPEVSDVKGNPLTDKEMSYQVNVEIDPELECKPLNELEFKRLSCTITEADIDEMIDDMRKQRAVWRDDDELVFAEGTRATVDFTGRTDGKEFEGGAAKNFELIAGETHMIPGFMEQILEHKAKKGDSFTIKVTFPEDYQAENLKGKDAEFDITVNQVAKRELPEIDEAFIRSFGLKSGKMDDFRAQLKKNMEREKNRLVRTYNASRVSNALTKQYGEFEVCSDRIDSAVEFEENRLRSYYKIPENRELPFGEEAKKQLRENATRRARVSKIMETLAAQGGIKLGNVKSIEREIDNVASVYDDPASYRRYVRTNKKEYRALTSVAYETDVLDYILKESGVPEEQVSFQKLIHEVLPDGSTTENED
ncbi:MAG: trigger factor [Succinivibrio sp.]|nr:trigger factor [Succinivibrio sp.]